jgi:hypothetical protein
MSGQQLGGIARRPGLRRRKIAFLAGGGFIEPLPIGSGLALDFLAYHARILTLSLILCKSILALYLFYRLQLPAPFLQP